MGARTQANVATDGLPLELAPLLSPFGRDRRVALRIEHMPSRARLSRGRNNGDGSWSLTRDELSDLLYLPPKGATVLPTLTVRIIGLDAGDGATLSVQEYAVEAGDAADDSAPLLDEVSDAETQAVALDALRVELNKAKAALRASQAELNATRKSWDAILNERLDDAAAEAAASFEEKRAAWQAELKERLAKAESRAQERAEQARTRSQRDAEAEIAKAQEEWRSGETARFAAAEARWREQTTRALAKESAKLERVEAELDATRAEAASNQPDTSELRRLHEDIARLRTAVSDREKKLAEEQASSAAARQRADTETAAALARAEESWKTKLDAAEAKWQEQSARALKQAAERTAQAEAALSVAREDAKSARERRDTPEMRGLRDQISRLESDLADREQKLAQAQSAAPNIERVQKDAAAALSKAEESWKARFTAAQAKWQEQSARALKEVAERLEQTEAALAEAQASRDRRDTTETRRLRAELDTSRRAIAERDKQIAEAQASVAHARKRSEDVEAALASAEDAWKSGEAARLAAAEARWQEQSARAEAALAGKLERAEAALATARAESRSARDRQETAETRRLRDALADVQVKLSRRETELAEARSAAVSATEEARQELQSALAKEKKDWEVAEATRFSEAKARWHEQADRQLRKATKRSEAAEAALSEARAEANATRDHRESAELRRLRSEFAAARERLTEREAELAEAQLAAGRARELTREEVEAALLKAEEAWKATLAVRISEIETQERDRGARALAEAVARLERTESALKDARAHVEAERERGAIAQAESTARLARSESALQEARTRIESLRDPVNETELLRLRSELAALQVACSEHQAEMSRMQAATRTARDRSADRTRAALQRAEEIWRQEEARRLDITRRDWERETRSGISIGGAHDALMEEADAPRTSRLAIDSLLAVTLSVLVVLGVIFYPRLSHLWTGPTNAGGIGMSKAAAAIHPDTAKPAQTSTPPELVVTTAANLRAAPAGESRIITTLPRGVRVTLLEKHNSWIHVRVEATGGTPAHDGWVFATSLKQTATH
jgi:chromosome segregation ATPase